MKLVIQIPCLDEAGTLPLTPADLPTEVAGSCAAGRLAGVALPGRRGGAA